MFYMHKILELLDQDQGLIRRLRRGEIDKENYAVMVEEIRRGF